MALVTRTLTNAGAPLYSPDGDLLVGVKIHFQLSDTGGRQSDAWDAITNERVGGETVVATTDAAGEFAVELWPNTRGNRTTKYKCRVQYEGFREFSGIVEDVPGDLQWVDFMLGGSSMEPQDMSAIAAAMTSHLNAADPHTQYAKESDLGGAASLDVGTTTGTVAAGDDARLLAVADKVDKIAGKGLSTEDYSTAEKGKLAAVATGATANAIGISRPAYLEQFLSGFFGRGMLAAETINVFTEQAITATAAAGSSTVDVTDATYFLVGGCITIKHDNGRYGTYFISAKSSLQLTVYPPLRNAVSAASKVERTWYNRAHPGKFYMRELAQRIARSTEYEAAIPNGDRVVFTAFANAAKYEDKLVALSGAAISYFDASNIGSSGSTTTPPRFAAGRTAYVATAAIGRGAETAAFALRDGNYVAKIVFGATLNTPEYKIEVVDETGTFVLASYIPPMTSQRLVAQEYTIPFSALGVRLIKLRVVCTASAGGFAIIGRIDVFAAPASVGKIVDKPSGKIVVLGDSWVAGDLGGSLEREPLTQQLALELPAATVINAGVGGNKIWEMLARFDADVAVHAPDYVVLSTGANESYNPASVTFEPNSTDYFVAQLRLLLQKIAGIGARPIIVGVPALAESDAATAYVNWELNDRARAYNRVFARCLGAAPLALGGMQGGNIRRLDLTLTSGATPSVKNAARVELAYPTPTTITNLLDGVDGQIVTLLAGNGNATLSPGLFVLSGGLAVTLTTNSSITLMRRDPLGSNSWVEIARSIAGAPPPSELAITEGATPSVAGAYRIRLNYAAAENITNFTGGTSFQEIQVRAANGNVTLKQGTLKLTGGVDITLTEDSVVTLLKMDVALSSRWVEVSRSIK